MGIAECQCAVPVLDREVKTSTGVLAGWECHCGGLFLGFDENVRILSRHADFAASEERFLVLARMRAIKLGG